MTLILKQIFGLIRILNSETGETQIAIGICCGLILGFSPIVSLQAILVVICILVFRIQAGAAFTSAFLFALISFLFDPLLHKLGSFFLEIDVLYSTYQVLYNLPLVPYTKFNNSVVMGSAVFSFVLVIPLFFLSRSLVVKYRETIVAKFKETKAWKVLKATAFYKWYIKYYEYFG